MIHYTTQGAGQPLVLIHGFPNDSSAWTPVLHGLQHYRLILPDLPGAGLSPLPPAPLSMAGMAEAVKEVMDREGIAKAVLAGHSMGGYTALEFAARYPERVQGLSLVHSLASPDSDEKKENRRKSIALIRKGRAEQEMFLRGMAQNLFAEDFGRTHPGAAKAVVEKGMSLPGDTLAAFYQAIMDRSDKRPLLTGAAFPVQWIIGNEDTATPMKDALDQCHLAAVNDVRLYRPCGHMSFVEMPDRLIADLDAFMQYCGTIA